MRPIPRWFAVELIGHIKDGWTVDDIAAAIAEFIELDQMAQAIEQEHAATHRVIRGAVLSIEGPEDERNDD